MKLSLHDVRQVQLCLRHRAALDGHARDDAIQAGRAVTLLPLRGNVEGQPTRCWIDELKEDGLSLLSRRPMEDGERFLLRLPREGESGIWLRCRSIRSRAATHDDLYLVLATFEAEAQVVGLCAGGRHRASDAARHL